MTGAVGWAFAAWQFVSVLGNLAAQVAFGVAPPQALSRLANLPEDGFALEGAPLPLLLQNLLASTGLPLWLAARGCTQLALLLCLWALHHLARVTAGPSAARRAVFLFALSPAATLLAPADGRAILMLTCTAALLLAALGRRWECAVVSLVIPLSSGGLWALANALMKPDGGITPPWTALAASWPGDGSAFATRHPTSMAHVLLWSSAVGTLGLAFPVARRLGWPAALLPLCLLGAGLMMPAAGGTAVVAWTVGGWAVWLAARRDVARAFVPVLAAVAMASGVAVCVTAVGTNVPIRASSTP